MKEYTNHEAVKKFWLKFILVCSVLLNLIFGYCIHEMQKSHTESLKTQDETISILKDENAKLQKKLDNAIKEKKVLEAK